MSADRPPTDLDALVEDELRAFLIQEGKRPVRLTTRVVLTEELGLSSAEVAALIPRIGARLGLAPRATSFADVRTIGDLAALYQSESRRSEDESLERIRRRAEARRQGRLV